SKARECRPAEDHHSYRDNNALLQFNDSFSRTCARLSETKLRLILAVPEVLPLFVIAVSRVRPICADSMHLEIIAAATFSGLALAGHLASVLTAMIRCAKLTGAVAPPPDAPGVTLVRPVCGIDNFIEQTLTSSFALDYPRYEIIFCVANAKDPVLPLVRALLAAHPAAHARLLIGDERISTNPKLNNCVKGWNAAVHDWIVLADSNVLMPKDYIQRLLAAWRPRTGLVCSPPVGSHPHGFWAE